ncbi:nuclear transport factor 2 family protein [Pseudomonas sp. 10S4]|uniref:nuclear transport factor 2 family protein n=1 Tax=Pseudomonas sp. 10S4 TaxID=3048583 RepID=UPI002AC990B4|nr:MULTISPECIES: nuclear transport factor 2 family protein [unclassified Pseudomonas]MEB0228471.1 nuclear transport factor 2 family protein [Pseudomonas sp. 5S1]MEB0295820.1 nuclear transport factor 2 family protein [Pseudomonas sp. 10S4]WPX18107.1 nuclear transport factor 2 family protein [Pseudomonas sp. 10S4]
MSNNDLASRVEAIETRFALDRLIAEYAQAFDTRDESLLRGIWHEDARLDLGAAFGSYEGVEAIVESAHTNWKAMPHMHHWMANALIDIDGDTATARAAVDCLCTHIEMGPIQISGLYHDTFERRQGRWAFIERRFDLHFLTPLPNWKPIAGGEAAS